MFWEFLVTLVLLDYLMNKTGITEYCHPFTSCDYIHDTIYVIEMFEIECCIFAEINIFV